MRTLLLALCLCALLPLLLTADPAPPQKPGSFVLSLARDAQGDVWAGTEADGLWRCDPAGHWTQFTTADGLGEDTVTALVCDGQGRVWAGHSSRGVSVFNGKTWRGYDTVTGPLGGHVFALAVCPTDGDVWMATDRGLARWSQSKDAWTYLTRATGLPDDQVSALAFAPDGTLYAAMQADGVAAAAPADGYHAWRLAPGAPRAPQAPVGSGLPSVLVNALLVGRDGSVYAGTDWGLAGSRDGGKTWSFLRGQDWWPKVNDQTPPVPSPYDQPVGELLSEDYVTCLAEDADGDLWIGHRRQGIEHLDPQTGWHVPLAPQTGAVFARALLLPDGKTPWVGTYGGGLQAPPSPAPPAVKAAPTPAPPLPSPAAPPDAATLAALLQTVQKPTPPLKPGEGEFLGDDWQTEGDWVGRYGHQYGDLCGMQSPFDFLFGDTHLYSVDRGIGPHFKDGGGAYTYIATLSTNDPRILYAPQSGTRRDSETNDGSWDAGKYPLSYEGPDLWVTVHVPDGLHRVSLYFVNNDGHSGDNRMRDYALELKPAGTTPTDGDWTPPQARTRVADFYGGVYKQFLVQGPGSFPFKVGRNYSSCTKLQGVFVDRLSGTPGTDPIPPPPFVSNGGTYAGLGLQDRPTSGVLVAHVEPNSPAQAAGIQSGDVITRAAGQAVTTAAALTALIAGQKPGDTFWVQITRPGQAARMSLKITLGLKPPDFSALVPLLGGTTYAPPTVKLPADAGPTLTAALALWTALDAADGRTGGAASDAADRVLAYRAAVAAGAPVPLLANWRWTLCLWTPEDRQGFDDTMRRAWLAQLVQAPQLGARGQGKRNWGRDQMAGMTLPPQTGM